MGAGKRIPPPLSDSIRYVVEFDGLEDPVRPLNWTLGTKLYNATIACLGTLVVSFTSAVFAPGTLGASKTFDVGREVGTLGTTLYVLGFAFGPLIWAPASELIGRRWPLTLGMLGDAVFTIASATSKDIQTLIICRFFAGVFGASQLSVVPGVLADLYDDTRRGIAISLYALTVFVGPFSAPFIGGFIATSSLGWRWTLYIPAIMGFASGMLLLFSLKETYAPVLLVSKAAKIRRETGNWAIHAKHGELEVDFHEIVTKYFTRPLRMLVTEPILLLITMYMSFIYGIVYGLLGAYPYVFETIYGMSPGIAGLSFIGLILGQVLACGFIVAHAIYVRRSAVDGKAPAPEWRLFPPTIGAPVFTIGIFWFGWTGFTSSIHWMSPIAASVFIGFGILCIFLPCFNYLIDAYLPLAASAVAANIILRSAVAAAFPLFSKQMFANLGVQWAATLLGCLAAVMIPIPFAFRRFGGRLRGGTATTPEVSRSALNTHTAVRSLTANSGAAFVRRMGLKLDPANAPRLNLFGWNIGARELSSGVPIASGLPIEAIVSYDDMRKLADVYMRKVHTCYGFIDEVDLSQRLDARWEPGSATSMFDSVLAGIAAIGLLFSERTVKVTEILLVELAKSMLESYDGSAAPPLDIITGSLLRVIYMRMTAPPYATWLASSKLIHLIEAAGLHREGSDGVDTSSLKLDPTLRRRLLGVAQHQNMWTSYDLGLSPVRLKTDISSHAHLGNMPSGDFTDELLGLLPASVNLDPEQNHDDHDLQMTLIQILDREHTQPPSIMAQTNVVLCILRRLHLLNINTSPNLTARILQQFKRALESARTMVEDCSPWQHMPNVPFNIITILLELDTYAALDQLPDAMETLKTVASAYNTPTMREAYATARLLVYLYQQRRFHDAQVLGNLLSRLESDSGRTSTEPQDIRRAPDLEVPFLEELISDIPTLQGFDFEQFLNNADMAGIAQGMDFSTES
ncbi:major facilitator superfamily domain-containing protein [Aspergillus keveii]|uniref:Major facilitator superfamily domain-containing protein n=1 Tax=Aspergillus keveii TaxID=714993 RepID=A0ABR4FNI1_9EURO